MKNLITLIIVVFLLISCQDEINVITTKQPGKIVGTVLPQESIATIKLIQGEVVSTTTTENGVFTFEDVEPGIYRISIKADNFGKQEIENIKVEDGEGNDIGTIHLSKYPYPLISTSPFDGEVNVNPFGDMILSFSEKIDPSALESGISIEPNAEILRRYYSSSNQYFYFDLELNFETEYIVTLDTTITTIYGEPLEFPAIFTFRTNYFALTEVDYPIISSYRYEALSLYFNGGLSENYEESITIEPAIPIMTNLSTNRRYVKRNRVGYSGFSILPINGWMADTTFNITVSKNLEEINGANLRKDTTITFTTPSLTVIKSTPVDGAYFRDIYTNIRIETNYLLDQGTIQNAVSISPNVEYVIQTQVYNNRTIIYLNPNNTLAPETEYTFTLNTSLTDIYGVNLREDYILTFNTGK
ncbi:MAG: Ig-like domain-containing protein [Melioribacteraceae bacterium]|nr:Ig-like domain-containing protein [Melioribacteraceae bacterium]